MAWAGSGGVVIAYIIRSWVSMALAGTLVLCADETSAIPGAASIELPTLSANLGITKFGESVFQRNFPTIVLGILQLPRTLLSMDRSVMLG